MIKKMMYKCEGCGVDRPCVVETNQEPCPVSYPIEDLKCILDETNQTGFLWKRVSPAETLAEVEKELNGLLMEVAQKFPHESRYETAKRYIRERESRIANAASPALSNSEGKPKCPKHETGGGPCYCDKQGGSDDG